MSIANLGRTTKGNFVLYSSDGLGRDGYITYNDGGFWKDNIKQIIMKPDYPKRSQAIFRSLNHDPAPFNYQSDGSGRDSYVLEHNGGLVKNFEPLIKQKLSKFLRKDENFLKRKIFLTKSQKQYLSKLQKIQNNVINRLYNDSLEKIKNNKKKLKQKALSGFFEENKIIKNFGGISPIKNYKDRENYNSLNKNNYNYNCSKFLSPSKDRGQKNLFDRMLKKRSVNKKNSMKNFPYFDKTVNTDKIKILKNLKINSSFFNNKFIKTTNSNINHYEVKENKNHVFNSNKKNNKYNVVVSPYDENEKIFFLSDNSINKNINNIDCYNKNNKVSYFVNNDKLENYSKIENNRMNKTDYFKSLNKTKIKNKNKRIIINDSDYLSIHGNFLKKKKSNL